MGTSTVTAAERSGQVHSWSRVVTLDFVRGIAMILMAIDHVRVYSGVPPGGPTPGIFFTRWVTHFVAPTFVFLAGTAAYLHGRKLADRAALARFLLLRGAFLVLLELTVIRLAWTFNLDFAHYLLAGVIWMIGWCMIIMAGAIFLPVRAITSIGLLLIALHNMTDVFRGPITQAFGPQGPNWLLKLLYFGGSVSLGGPPLLILYVIVPWIGVMMAGYGFGAVMACAPEERRKICLRIGLAATSAFVLLRLLDFYGDPRPWHSMKMSTLLAFLNTTKYPASLSFLLMTLGPMFIVLALAENWRGKAMEATAIFGRVPMFYYLLHIPVIHAAACAVSLIREGHVNPWLFANHPLDPGPVPDGYMWNLAVLYLVFAICILGLYFPCRSYARLRATRKYPWLSYI